MSTRTVRLLKVGIAVLVVVLALLVGTIVGSTSKSVADPDEPPVLTATVATPGEGSAHQAIEAALPDSPAEVMTTPPTGEWWAALATMIPTANLADLDPTAAGVTLTGYAYSLNATQGANARDMVPSFPALYAQTASVQDATTLSAWINEQPGGEGRRAWRDGTVTIVVPSWVDQTAEFTLDTTSATEALAAMIGQPDSTAVWTLNIGRFDTVLRDSLPDVEQRDRVNRLMKAFGLTDTSTVTVTSTSPTGVWTGAARDLDPTGVQLGSIATLISGSSRVLAQDPTSGSFIRDSGMNAVLRDNTFTAWVDGAPANTVGVADHSGEALRADNTTTVLSGRVTPNSWQSALRGSYGDKVGANSIEFALAVDGAVAIKPVFDGSAEINVGGPATANASVSGSPTP
jgi:hypothetical protein